MMDFKSIVFSLGKLHYGPDPDYATMYKQLVGLLRYLEDLLHFMLITNHMFVYL